MSKRVRKYKGRVGFYKGTQPDIVNTGRFWAGENGFLYAGGGLTSDSTRITKFTLDGELYNVVWPIDNGSTVNDIATDSFGNVFIATFYTPANYTIRKYSSKAQLLWTIDLGVSGNSIVTDKDGNVYVNHVRTSNLTTRKYNSAGALQWSVDYGGSAIALDVDKDGNVYVGGGIVSNNTLRKYNSTGTLVWSRKSTDSTGGCYAISIDDSGNVYTANGFDNVNLSTVVKYNSSGSVLWRNEQSSTVGGSVAIAVDKDKNIYIKNFKSSKVIQYVFDGTDYSEGWSITRLFGKDTTAGKILVDKDNYIYVCGATYGGLDEVASITKYDFLGNIIWDAGRNTIDSNTPTSCIALYPPNTGSFI